MGLDHGRPAEILGDSKSSSPLWLWYVRLRCPLLLDSCPVVSSLFAFQLFCLSSPCPHSCLHVCMSCVSDHVCMPYVGGCVYVFLCGYERACACVCVCEVNGSQRFTSLQMLSTVFLRDSLSLTLQGPYRPTVLAGQQTLKSCALLPAGYWVLAL